MLLKARLPQKQSDTFILTTFENMTTFYLPDFILYIFPHDVL